MDIKLITLPSDTIADWDTFHTAFQEKFGFPGFYGRNMDAWIDCMGSLDDPSSGMTAVTVKKGGLVALQIENSAEFKKCCPEQYNELLECSAFVNYRNISAGRPPIIALILT